MALQCVLTKSNFVEFSAHYIINLQGEIHQRVLQRSVLTIETEKRGGASEKNGRRQRSNRQQDISLQQATNFQRRNQSTGPEQVVVISFPP
jgi:hypothetical protein